jgi:hypothetical protein
LAEAPSFGQTILDYAPNCPGAMDYRTLAQRLLERWDKEDGRAGDAGRLAPSASVQTAVVETVREESSTPSATVSVED